MAHGMYGNGNSGGKRGGGENQYGKPVTKGASKMGKTSNPGMAGSKTIPVMNTGSKAGGGAKSSVTW